MWFCGCWNQSQGWGPAKQRAGEEGEPLGCKEEQASSRSASLVKSLENCRCALSQQSSQIGRGADWVAEWDGMNVHLGEPELAVKEEMLCRCWERGGEGVDLGVQCGPRPASGLPFLRSCPSTPHDLELWTSQLLPLTQATGITEELYRRTYAFCIRLLTLPTPYCMVALDCAIRLKTEAAVPGKSCRDCSPTVTPAPPKGCLFLQNSGSSKVPAPSVGRVGNGGSETQGLDGFAGTLYQRLVIAEQNLTNELYPYQER